MEIACPSCKRKWKIAADKVDLNKKTSFRCKQCGGTIEVNPAAAASSKDAKPAPIASEDNGSYNNGYDADEKPFDFVEEEGKTALVCEQDKKVKKKVIDILNLMEYHITDTANHRDALKKMRYHDYNLIVLNEKFDTRNPDTNGVLIYLERMPMLTRRNMYVTLLSDRFRTMDNMMAFEKSVNLIVNTQNIDDFDKILGRGIADHEYFYRLFMEIDKEIHG